MQENSQISSKKGNNRDFVGTRSAPHGGDRLSDTSSSISAHLAARWRQKILSKIISDHASLLEKAPKDSSAARSGSKGPERLVYGS